MAKYSDMILALINESDGHMTAEEIFFELRKTNPRIVLATVYNNLNVLSRQGLVRKMSLEGSPDRYDKVEKHDHLVCKKCGRLSDIRFKDLTKSLEEQLGDDIVFYDLKVFYVCPQCKGKKA